MTDPNMHGFRLIDRSTLVTTDNLTAMIPPLHAQANEATKTWQMRGTISVTLGNPARPALENVMDIVILDDADQADALGYHDVDPHGKPYARVFARPVLDHGGQVLSGGNLGVSVASVISHELLEALVDQYANQWIARPDSRSLVAKELCDPVQGFSYTVAGVDLSDWVTPNWFVAGSRGPWDRMGKCTQAFQVAQGGYQILADLSGERAVANDTAPEWRQASRHHPAARTCKRITATAPALARVVLVTESEGTH